MKNNKKPSHLILFLFILSYGFCQAQTIDIGDTIFSYSLLKVGAGQASISVCDFNSDGHKDVLISNYSEDTVIAYQGNGKGRLNEVGRYSSGKNPTGMDVADINGDGNIDVAIANHETSFVSLLLGDGKGGFKEAANSPLSLAVDPHPHAVGLKDLDGDSIVDLIVDDRTHNGLLVLKGQGNGRFKTPGQLIDVGGDPYRGFAIDDINGDKHLDILTPNQQAIGIVSNKGSKSFDFSLKTLASSKPPFAVELAEINGDGILDAIVVFNGDSINIIPGDGKGNFIEKKKTTIRAATGAKQIAVGDINDDGIEDVLVSSWSGEVQAVLGNKNNIKGISFNHPSIPNPWGVAMVDLNEDGKSDFIIADGDSDTAVVYVSQN